MAFLQQTRRLLSSESSECVGKLQLGRAKQLWGLARLWTGEISSGFRGRRRYNCCGEIDLFATLSQFVLCSVFGRVACRASGCNTSLCITGRDELANIRMSDSIKIKELKQRYEICKLCSRSPDSGLTCAIYKSCCFGKWRTKPESKCPEGKW